MASGLHGKNSAALANMLSSDDCLRYQGSAEGEEWSGQPLRDGLPDHAREVPDFGWTEHSIEAFEHGGTGWAHTLATLHFHNNGKSVQHRFTHVLVLENGQWRIVQMHVSNGRSNMEKIGIEHHVLDDLVEAARAGFQQHQREGMASVMFTDIVGSSSMANLLGDRVWAQTVQIHLNLATEVIESHDGRLVKSLGDGTMSSFPSARSALSAALELQSRNLAAATEPALALRTGIHSGDVIQTDDDFFGNVVNKAARISAACAADEILISDATRLLAGRNSDFDFVDGGEISLRGLPGTHRVYVMARPTEV
ncbi:MAG: adenylate/guanylate cyclase domain-containing protein [Paracoccaceae bacterium]